MAFWEKNYLSNNKKFWQRIINFHPDKQPENLKLFAGKVQQILNKIYADEDIKNKLKTFG